MVCGVAAASRSRPTTRLPDIDMPSQANHRTSCARGHEVAAHRGRDALRPPAPHQAGHERGGWRCGDSMPQTVFSAAAACMLECSPGSPAIKPHWGRSSKLAAAAAAAVCRHTCRAHGGVPGSPGDGLDDVHSRGGLAGGLVEHSATSSGALRLHLLGAHSNRDAALLADLGSDRGAGERGARGAQSSGHVLPALGPWKRGLRR